MFERDILNLPILLRAYVALIVLTTVFSMVWYKTVMQRSLAIYHGISHLWLAFSWYTHWTKDWCVYQKIQVTSGLFHGRSRESVA